MTKHTFYFILLYFCSIFILNGEISFTTKELNLYPKIEDNSIKCKYEFTNSGKSSITIISVKTSCGCTTAFPDTYWIPPGGMGNIFVEYNINVFFEDQEKEIIVETSDVKNNTYHLIIKINSPLHGSIDPLILLWKLNEKLEPKEITIKLDPALKIHLVGVRSSNDNLFAVLKTITTYKDYKIILKPIRTDILCSAVLSIETNLNYPKKYFHLKADIR